MLRSTVVCALALLTSCAWTNRANRPVWNAFEGNLVPESSTAFVCTLPLTVPAGLLAIVGDTFVAHPIQVVDDALGDAGDVWDPLTLQDSHYYTNAAEVPFRAVWTPVVFVGSFAGRSLFDIARRGEREAAEEQRLGVREYERQVREHGRQQGRLQTLAWLQSIAEGQDEPCPSDAVLDAELLAAIDTALTRGTALGRLAVYEWAARHDHFDWSRALGDESAAVRFRVLSRLRPTTQVAADVQQRLLADPDPAVRELAAQRFR